MSGVVRVSLPPPGPVDLERMLRVDEVHWVRETVCLDRADFGLPGQRNRPSAKDEAASFNVQLDGAVFHRTAELGHEGWDIDETAGIATRPIREHHLQADCIQALQRQSSWTQEHDRRLVEYGLHRGWL